DRVVSLANDTEGFPVRRSVREVSDVVPDIRMDGRGWGHGVGFSQFGGYALALDGRSPGEILTYYYPGTEITSDERASSQRIRVGIRTGQQETTVTARDGEVTWQLCTPDGADLAANGRVPADRCAEWTTQAIGEQVRIRPLTASGTVVEGTVWTSDDPATLVEVEPEDPDEPVPAPFGGFVLERRDGEDWQPSSAYVVPDDGRSTDELPVARAVHGDASIVTQSYASPDRPYAFGWRDIHLVGDRVADVPSHRLTLVQDVDTVERYLRGLAEVPSSWPDASLEAQAIAGRTYALRGSRGGSCRCDKLASASDQVFIGEGKIEEPTYGVRWGAAVAATRDQVLTYNDELAQTFYSSSFGGRSENIEDSWAYYRAYQDLADNPPPAYLRSVDDPWSVATEVNGTEISNSRRDWSAVAANSEFTAMVNREREAEGLEPYSRIERIRIGDRTTGLTPRSLLLTGVTDSGEREEMTYLGTHTSDGRTLARPVAGATIRLELPIRAGGESNGRVSSSQIMRFGFPPFTDDDGSTHEYAISWAAAIGVAEGVSDTSFEPEQDVTRGQMASFLFRTFAIPEVEAGGDGFSDVEPTSTHAAAIEAIADAGIALGYTDGTYRPDEPIKRQEFASLLARAMALQTSTEVVFDDVRADTTHAAAIAAVAEVGITRGCAEARFCPEEPVSRGQMASFLFRAAAE
ncbi:MAG: SpoIID/LytB domain-containing protein, partial [Nitriliruptoraceae bacterium]